MLYLFRFGPNDREGQYVGSWPSLSAIEKVIRETIATPDKKIVIRETDRGIQFIVKDPQPTLEALSNAVCYQTSRDKSAPPVRPVQYKMRDRVMQPGDRLPPPHVKIG